MEPQQKNQRSQHRKQGRIAHLRICRPAVIVYTTANSTSSAAAPALNSQLADGTSVSYSMCCGASTSTNTSTAHADACDHSSHLGNPTRRMRFR